MKSLFSIIVGLLLVAATIVAVTKGLQGAFFVVTLFGGCILMTYGLNKRFSD